MKGSRCVVRESRTSIGAARVCCRHPLYRRRHDLRTRVLHRQLAPRPVVDVVVCRDARPRAEVDLAARIAPCRLPTPSGLLRALAGNGGEQGLFAWLAVGEAQPCRAAPVAFRRTVDDHLLAVDKLAALGQHRRGRRRGGGRPAWSGIECGRSAPSGSLSTARCTLCEMRARTSVICSHVTKPTPVPWCDLWNLSKSPMCFSYRHLKIPRLCKPMVATYQK